MMCILNGSKKYESPFFPFWMSLRPGGGCSRDVATYGPCNLIEMFLQLEHDLFLCFLWGELHVNNTFLKADCKRASCTLVADAMIFLSLFE